MRVSTSAQSGPPAFGVYPPFAWLTLLGVGLVDLVRGGAHFLLPDGGAAAAGMALGYPAAPDLVYVFGVSGAFEMLLAAWLILVALRERRLLALGLWTQILKSGLVLLTGATLKPPAGAPPGAVPDWGTLAAAALALLVLALAHRRKQ